VGPVRLPKKAHQDTLHQTCVLHPMGSVGHLVHCVVSGTQNVESLFFMIGADRYGFHKKRNGAHYTKLVFLHPVRIPEKARWDMLHRTCVFASGGIYRSRSALRCIRGVKHQRTIFHAQVGRVRIAQKARWDTLRQTSVFALGGIFGSRSAFRCVRVAKHRRNIFLARLGPVRIQQA
jgi:hypothetical protein